jgi:hypothetical protein
MAYPSLMPINAEMTAPKEVQPRSPPPLQVDTAQHASSPGFSFREGIITAAGRLAQPVAKRRKVIASKPLTGQHRPREDQTPDVPSRQPIRIPKAAKSEAESRGQHLQDHRQEQSMNGGSSTDLSKKTLGKLATFRFQPPQKAVKQQYDSSSSLKQRVPLVDQKASADTVVLQVSEHDGHKSSESYSPPLSEGCTEATLPLDFTLLECSSAIEKGHSLKGEGEDSSPSPFDVGNFDLGSFEDDSQTVVNRVNNNFTEYVNDEDLIFNLEAQHKSSPAESDFGSDPFEADHNRPELEFHRSSSVSVNPCGSPPNQSPQADFPTSEPDYETMLPPSFQTPHKSPPIEDSLTMLPPFQPLTPDTRPARKQTFPQPSSPTPFLRTKFPKPVAQRSPISNLTSGTRILTCFRIAEYFRAISSSTSTTDLLVELYATVTFSIRVDNIQHFKFADLFFPNRPPHLQGTCTTWYLSELYENDTSPFLGVSKEQGKLCRAIVRPKRWARPSKPLFGSSPVAKRFATDGGSPGSPYGEAMQTSPPVAEVEVLNIWEAAWEDVEYMRGIVDA